MVEGEKGLPTVNIIPEYELRLLPSSAIQFIIFWYRPKTEAEIQDQLARFGYPGYAQLPVNQFDFNKIA